MRWRTEGTEGDTERSEVTTGGTMTEDRGTTGSRKVREGIWRLM